jgi:hypothetical protein
VDGSKWVCSSSGGGLDLREAAVDSELCAGHEEDASVGGAR